MGPPKPVTNSIGMKFVLVPAGDFLMGSPDSDKDAEKVEKPQHQVRIMRPFYLGVTEVTQGQYRSVAGENPSFFKGSDDLPVEQVLWEDAIAFCNKLSKREGLTPYYVFGARAAPLVQSGSVGYRLPTQTEWEYACRAGTSTRYSFGDDEASLGEYAWIGGNSSGKTHPVGQKRQNTIGLFDMHGNVSEWCWDGTDKNFYSRGQGRVNRGGGWCSGRPSTRSAARYDLGPGGQSYDVGFRLARDQSGS